MTIRKQTVLLLAALTLAGCSGDGAAEDVAPVARVRPAYDASRAASLVGSGYVTLTPEEMERGRFDRGWRAIVGLDTVVAPDTTPYPESWDSISVEVVNRGATHLPISGDVSGPSVLTTQILLDRALFSPGIIDGRWGVNTEKAIYWLQEREGLSATGTMDQATFERVAQLAGSPDQLVRAHTLSAEDVEGPVVEIPEDIYEKAKLECMCYSSLPEKLAEMFHTSPDLLQQLNPGVDLAGLAAGAEIQVPNVRDPSAARDAQIDRLVISDGAHYLHALDANGRILMHFPSTLGSTYDPSPEGDHRVVSITREPWWHYQPSILAHVPDDEPEANIPPGPNNAVGMVWMALSKPHYGIHGTSAPETIGYATSAGCVRLTNWDALFLADRLEEGTAVEFTDEVPRALQSATGG